MGLIHLGHEQGLAESWQRDRGLHENAVKGLRLLAEHMTKKKTVKKTPTKGGVK